MAASSASTSAADAASSCDGEAECSKTAAAAAVECAVCLQSAVYPVRLPCAHVFCFLCVKGLGGEFGGCMTWSSDAACPLCRAAIPADYISRPQLIDSTTDGVGEAPSTAQWLYTGRQGGWWQYDDRTALELERAYNDDCGGTVQVLIAGHVYVIELEAMVQYRRDQPARRRNVKRVPLGDRRPSQVKGVAGIMRHKLNA